MRFDARNDDDCIGLGGNRIARIRDALTLCDLDDVHRRFDRCADARFGDPEVREHRDLPLRRSAAVRTHRREDERLAPCIANRLGNTA